MKQPNLIKSFGHAINGIVHSVIKERNIRIHLFTAAGVILLSLALGVSRTEFILLLFCIALVITCEMLNTGLELTLDIIYEELHHKIKIAKDIAAGAVLAASIFATLAGYLILYPYLGPGFPLLLRKIQLMPEAVTLIALLLTLIGVVFGKAFTGKGEFLRGGMPSGHSAAAFSIWTATIFLTKNLLVAILVLVMALTITHSRAQFKIHSRGEVISGAILGTLVTLFLFQVFG